MVKGTDGQGEKCFDETVKGAGWGKQVGGDKVKASILMSCWMCPHEYSLNMCSLLEGKASLIQNSYCLGGIYNRPVATLKEKAGLDLYLSLKSSK